MRRFQSKQPRSGLNLRSRGLMKLIPSKGDAPMSIKLTRNRRTRKLNSLPLFDWADAQRRLVARPTAAERLFRSRGYSNSAAKLLASKAGYPVEGD
jgi:hypothetical protein